ncbi:DUF6603 domain-containing protein [Sorangium sp. So ce1036]|uniref:DUF6603 domain-containing protein n=1 Tax=Sorangium sp. So ce1036 TaxID=3133328 RepID=UPI003F021BE4
MSRSRSLLRAMAGQLASIVDPLTSALQSPERMQQLLERLGVHDSEVTGPVAAFSAVQDLRTQLEALAAQDDLDFEAARAALQIAGSAFDIADAVSDLGGGVGTIEGLGRDLLDYLFETWLLMRHPLAREVMALLTLLEAEPDRPERPAVLRSGDEAARAPVKIDRVRLDRLPALLRDPVAVLKARYVNALATDADADAMADRLFPQLVQVLRALGVVCHYGIEPEGEAWLGASAPLMRRAMVIYAVSGLRSDEPEAGVVVALSPASLGDLGLVVSPFGALTFTKQVGRWQLQTRLTGQVDTVAWGRHGLTLLAQDAQIGAEISASTPTGDTTPAYVFGAADGTRVELGSVQLAARTALSPQEQSLSLAADVSRAALVIMPGDADGFLASVLPAQGLRADVDLGLAWSSDAGLTLRGSGGLEATLPVRISVGGLTLSHLHIALHAQDSQVSTELSASLGLSIGPVRAVVDRVGVDATLTFPARGGNLGVAALALGFRPPAGIGLTVEAHGVLTGGGYLFHDRERALYAGALQLSLQDRITLKAFGLVATRMPDGSRGYSMIVFITAENFRPVPLGMGFTLQGIGGMVAVHRTFNETALREGLQNNTLSTLLFPRDPVAQSTDLVRDLATVFPARRGAYLLGLLAKIGWSSPTLVTLDLALIYEFGARHRLIALGRVQSLLPSRDNALIQLNLDAMGLLDLDEGSAEIDAVLVDSRLAQRFPMTGAMALRARWTGGPRAGFVMAVGGFNPRFAAPANVPKLPRIAIALSAGDNPRLTCEAYFAITSNTIQFGARAHLYAAAIGFSVEGDVGFDVLVQLVPFHFLAEFRASVQLKRGSRNLFKVSVSGELEGPRPLRISGKASFEILWCDFSVRFDKTLVRGEKPPLPPAVNVLDQLQRAFADPQSWTTQRDAFAQHGVTLRALPAGGALPVLDPLGLITVKQQVVPLNTTRDIDLFGGAPVSGPRRFTLTASLGSGRAAQPGNPVTDQFAPAQFFRMSDDEKLAGPSFETLPAGVTFGSGAVAIDDAMVVGSPLTYETLIIDAAGQSTRPPRAAYPLPPQRLSEQVRHSAVAHAPVRRTGRARFTDPQAPQAVQVKPLRWLVASVDDASTQNPGAGTAATYSEQRAALGALNRATVEWQLVAAHEVT